MSVCRHKPKGIGPTTLLVACVCLVTSLTFDPGNRVVAADLALMPPDRFRSFSQEFCLDCHTGPDAEARLDLASLNEQPLQKHLTEWRRVQRVLQEQSMPPEDAEQPGSGARASATAAVEDALNEIFSAAAADPGPSLIRRLTNAEYEYCIEDLTGVSLEVASQLASDGVGGSGFTNAGSAQFMQDASLARYIETAKLVADHVVVGAGPLYFFTDPGQTGQELSAITRLQRLYREHGFRSSAGEGAKPFGLDRFPRAFHVAWKYRYRKQRKEPNVTLESLAREMDLEPKLARHIWSVMTRDNPAYPLSDIVAMWNALPVPDGSSQLEESEIAQRCEDLFAEVQRLQSLFASSASDEEEAALLYDRDIHIPSDVEFDARAVRKFKVIDDNFTPDLNNPDLYSEDGTIRWRLSVDKASDTVASNTAVIFSNPTIQFRVVDLVQPDPVPLQPLLSDGVLDQLQFGRGAGGQELTEDQFVIRAGESRIIEAMLPEDCRSAELAFHAQLDPALSADAIVRCTVEDITSERGRQYSTLLRDPKSQSIDLWEAGLEEFAAALPQISHREPAPSDRDPIPAPFDNTYNVAERNYFHTAIKYHRSDEFLIQNVAEPEVATLIDTAWTDLLTSFDYHDVNLRFVCNKFNVDRDDRSMATIDEQWLSSIDDEAAHIIRHHKLEYDRMQADLRAAEESHLSQLLQFASRAWRRPLTDAERQRLQTFYHATRIDHQWSHAESIRACLARILVSPSFLFRIESQPKGADPVELTGLELASRLSFSLWSSIPDAELLSKAERGMLADGDALDEQVRRMLHDRKARRFATEFFGQWLGFYQFDEFRGIDGNRFPQFDDELKRSLYDEAVSFFERIVREDRPYSEIIHADYTVASRRVAEHYGLTWPTEEFDQDKMVLRAPNRGGVFGLGAVLASTSAPLRTSPVKRGDWILRRLIGTPVPPPPADAGSIPAEEVLADGMTVRDRLESHRNRSECMGCHVRIDPLGFALENYDPLGRWRETYLDDQPIKAEGSLSDGRTIRGPEGLKHYMQDQDHSFRRTLASKLVGYFLGRSESVYDAQLIQTVADNLQHDPRFSTAIITIVRSPQFQQIRGEQSTAESAITLPQGSQP